MGRRMFRAGWVVLCLVLSAAGIFAQDNSPLVVGQPASGTIAAGGTLVYPYTAADARAATFQVLSETAIPTLTIFQDDIVVASQINAEGGFTTTLGVFLMAGDYKIEVGTVAETTGLVVLILQEEISTPILPLETGILQTGQVNAAAPAVIYQVNSLDEQSFLFINSSQPDRGIVARVSNVDTGFSIGEVTSDVLGTRFRLPAGSSDYQILVLYSGDPNRDDLSSANVDAFSVCFVAVSRGECGGSGEVATALPASLVPATQAAALCSLTPNGAGGVNVRQSASVNAPIVASFPGGLTVPALGISPDNAFYRVEVSSVVGWVSASVVTATGDCAGVAVVNPPPIAATAVPVQPTLPPTLPPTQPPPPTPVPPTVASGPCLITMTGEALVYTQPVADPSNIFDEVQPGYELIPVGRLADNSWWKTNYANAWIQTSNFGVVATVTGDCSGLAVVNP